MHTITAFACVNWVMACLTIKFVCENAISICSTGSVPTERKRTFNGVALVGE